MNFSDINQLIKHLNLDMSHWINAEVMKYAKRKNYEKAVVRLKHIPKELSSYKLKCPNGHQFKPNWLEKRFPTSVFYSEKKGLLKQASCYVKCTECGELSTFNIPDVNCTRNLDIYGDEAFRCVDGKTIFVYSFVSFSGSSEAKSEFEEEFREIKAGMSPGAPPDSWVIHMKEILSGSKRLRNPVISHLGKNDAMDWVMKTINLIAKYNNKFDINLYSAVGIAVGVNLKKHYKFICQEEIYTSALMKVIKETTDHELAPKFYFERTGNDGWAKTLFESGRMTLLWPWITNGLPVMSPKFVEPTHSIYLEIADIISFVIARYVYCIGRRVEGDGAVAEIDPSSLGLVRYILTDSKGSWNYENIVGFPDKAMLKGTHWEKFI